jgi:hypothetical protein
MEESSTYQAIIRKGVEKGKLEGKLEGELKEARDLLLLLGGDCFGEAPEAVRQRIEGLGDLTRLHRLALRVRTPSSWEDLLAGV